MYTLSIFVEGYPGYFQYVVETKEQAMNHFAAITSTGYRRINDREQFEWFAPSMLKTIKITGEGLETKYPDELKRT